MVSTKLAWVGESDPLPHPHQALANPPGLLAAGLDLSCARLDEAYRNGIFPWYSPGEPVLWWSPDPRMVLFCDEWHASHSLSKRLRQMQRAQQAGNFLKGVVTVDLAFDAVMHHCGHRGQPAGAAQTWITPAMQQVYTQWHREGRVHSVETWFDGQLVGGLYGVSLGRMFFGESMFSLATDASKLALAHLVAHLKRQAVVLIDCQMQTPHLASLGARALGRPAFLQHLRTSLQLPDIDWAPGWLTPEGVLHESLPAGLAELRTAQPLRYHRKP